MATDTGDGPRKTPRYREIAAKISGMIREGSYRPGERLPSTRGLSRQLRVGINTVTQAYALLENARMVEARPQSGYYVRSLPAAPRRKARPAAHDVSFGQTYLELTRSLADDRLVPLQRGTPDPELLPTARLSRMLASLGRNSPSACAAYASSNGTERLRRQIAKRSLDYGCTLSPEQIVVTSGCTEAVTLALQATCGAGDTVAVESPVHGIFLKSIQSMGLRILEVPATPREGMSLEVLAFAIGQNAIRACIVISNFSNPLGTLMPEAKKRELVRLLAKHGIPLIEDDVYGDLGYGRERPPALKAYDDTGTVLLCSSFSKTLAPGYRVGWIVPGRFQDRIEELKSLLNIATATPTQLAIAEFLSDGGYDRHLRATRKVLRERMTRVRESAARHFPPGTLLSQPEGGYFLWAEMPEEIDCSRLSSLAHREGIGLAPGMLFTAGAGFRNCARLNCSFWSPRIEGALETLGGLAEQARIPR